MQFCKPGSQTQDTNRSFRDWFFFFTKQRLGLFQSQSSSIFVLRELTGKLRLNMGNIIVSHSGEAAGGRYPGESRDLCSAGLNTQQRNRSH